MTALMDLPPGMPDCCPTCRAPVRLVDERIFTSAGGFVVQHVYRCTRGHYFDWIADEFKDW